MAVGVLPPVDGLQSGQIAFDGVTLDVLMPLHIIADAAGRIVRTGPTVPKLAGRDGLVGQDLLSVLTVRRPRGVTSLPGLMRRRGRRLCVMIDGLADLPLNGVAVALSRGGGVLINLSPGIAVESVVTARGLSARDFSPADPTIEMLVLFEVQRALMDQGSSLNERLQGAKTAAEHKAHTDPLTGLANRRALDRHLDRILRRHTRPDFALMQMDLDFFKQVNDTHGHAAGDHVLVEVSRRLVAATRPTDVVCRVGGDEFVILLPETGDPAVVADIGARIIAAVGQTIAFDGIDCRVGASIGATLVPRGGGRDVTRILSDADRALYRSKALGRGRFTFDTPVGV